MDLERFKSDIIPLRKKLLLFATKMMENDADAEDIVQETLLRLWNIREQLGNLSNPAGFAMQTTKNICIDKLRTKKQLVNIDDCFLETTENTPYSDAEKQDLVLIIKQIIENLPELQRCIIRMRDIEDYELEEIAEITGTRVSAVTVNLSRARKKVRERFGEIMNYRA